MLWKASSSTSDSLLALSVAAHTMRGNKHHDFRLAEVSWAESWKELKHKSITLMPCMFLPCSKLIQWRQKSLTAQGGVHAESPPHLNIATPFINYHHNSHGGIKSNAASHCHSYILLLLSNLMPSPGSSSLLLAAMVPVSPALSWDSRPAAPPWPGWGSPPLSHFLNFHHQEGEQHLQLSKEAFAAGQEGRGMGYTWGVSAFMRSSSSGYLWGQGWQSHTQLPGTSTDPCCGSCSTSSTSARKYSEFKHKTSAVMLQRNQQPANLTSSSMATAIMTMNVFYPAVFPPAGIHKKFCIRTNIKNIRARLDHFAGNRGHTWDCNVGVTVQKQQAIKQNNAVCVRSECCSKKSLWCRKNFN